MGLLLGWRVPASGSREDAGKLEVEGQPFSAQRVEQAASFSGRAQQAYISKAHLLFLSPAGHVIPHVSLVVSVYITQAPCLVSCFPTAPDSVAGPSATSVSDYTLTS